MPVPSKVAAAPPRGWVYADDWYERSSGTVRFPVSHTEDVAEANKWLPEMQVSSSYVGGRDKTTTKLKYVARDGRSLCEHEVLPCKQWVPRELLGYP